MKLSPKLRVVVLLTVVLLFGWVYYKAILSIDTASEECKLEKLRAPEKTCVDGHQYLIAYSSLGMAMAPSLNDDGTPVRCEQ